MDTFVQILLLALTVVSTGLILKKYAGPFSVALTALCICGLGVFAASRIRPVLDMLQRLETMTGLQSAIFAPVLKTALIGILTNVAAGVCADCGESGIAKMVELCGTAAALYLALPLVSEVLRLLENLLGGG